MMDVPALLSTILIDPMTVNGFGRTLLLLPLCLSISIVYKTLRSSSLTRVPLDSFVLWITIVLGMYAVGVAMWLVYLLLG
jgi:hypothetical protein